MARTKVKIIYSGNMQRQLAEELQEILFEEGIMASAVDKNFAGKSVSIPIEIVIDLASTVADIIAIYQVGKVIFESESFQKWRQHIHEKLPGYVGVKFKIILPNGELVIQAEKPVMSREYIENLFENTDKVLHTMYIAGIISTVKEVQITAGRSAQLTAIAIGSDGKPSHKIDIDAMKAIPLTEEEAEEYRG
jgi:hypothetical protein